MSGQGRPCLVGDRDAGRGKGTHELLGALSVIPVSGPNTLRCRTVIPVLQRREVEANKTG